MNFFIEESCVTPVTPKQDEIALKKVVKWYSNDENLMRKISSESNYRVVCRLVIQRLLNKIAAIFLLIVCCVCIKSLKNELLSYLRPTLQGRFVEIFIRENKYYLSASFNEEVCGV